MDKKRALALIFFVFNLNCVLSQDNAGTEELSTDRPDQTESPSLLRKGNFQIESGFFYEDRERENIRTQPLTYKSTLLRYGLLRNLEMRLGADLVRVEEEITDKGVTSYGTGWTPLLVGAKVGIAGDNGILPEIGLLVHLHLPFSASKEYRPERTGVDFRFAFSHKINSRSDLSYNVGAKWLDDDAEATYIYTVAYGYEVLPSFTLFAEVYADIPEEGRAEHQWDTGLTYLLQKNLQLDAFIGSGIESPQQFAVGAGISYRIVK